MAIQQQGPRAIGFFGTRNMGFMHQELIEILSYAMVITVRCCGFTQMYLKYGYVLACIAHDMQMKYKFLPIFVDKSLGCVLQLLVQLLL